MTGSKDTWSMPSFFPGIKSMSIFGMLDILPFHVNCDYNEVSHMSNREQWCPGP